MMFRLLAIGVIPCAFIAGCASTPMQSPATIARQALPALQGSYHTVRPGETLWRIAHSYGLEAHMLASANRVPDAGRLTTGQRLFIPLPPESDRFVWPLRGAVGASHAGGIDVIAAPGSLVRVSRSGRVAVATPRLSGWGKTVVVDHLDGYVSVYAGLDQLLVAPGAAVRQGMPVGTLGSRPLHFEIRSGTTPRSVVALLPLE